MALKRQNNSAVTNNVVNNSDLRSTYAQVLLAKVQLLEIQHRNKAIGLGDLFEIEIARLDKYLEELLKELE